jgi:hypothetical protein
MRFVELLSAGGHRGFSCMSDDLTVVDFVINPTLSIGGSLLRVNGYDQLVAAAESLARRYP